MNDRMEMVAVAGKETSISAWSVVGRFLPYMKQHKMLITGSAVAMVLEVGFRLLEPWPLKFIFDAARGRDIAARTGIHVFDSMLPNTLLTISAVAMVCIVSLRALSSYGRRVGFALAGNQVLAQVRADLFAHMQRLSLSFHSKRRTGDLATRLTSDVGRLQEVVSTAVLPLVVHILTVVGVAVIMLFIQWQLALVAFATLPLFWLSTQRLGKKIRSTARRERARHGEMGAIATEAIGSIHVVQTMGGEDTHNKRFVARNMSSLREGVQGKRLAAQLLGTADVFIALGTAILLWYGAGLVMAGKMELTTLLVFFFYHKNMTRPIRNVAKYSGRTAKALASAERIVELLDIEPDIVEVPDAIEAPMHIGCLSYDNVSFGYEADCHVIEHMSLEVKTGTVVALVGPSGAGKSTMMNLLLRLYDPVSGRIAVDGRDIRDFTIASWRKRVAVVPQETTLFAASVRENICFGQGEVSEDQIIAAAKLACADEFISQLPEGYDTVIGERGCTLSQGQRQRLAIARAAVRNAPILVFDEPTASLDNANTRAICQAIHNLSRDRICFLISHDLRTIADADVVVFMDGGKIVEQGDHAALMARHGRYASMYSMQLEHTKISEVANA